MADKKQYSNENTVSVWQKESKTGKHYFSGVVYVGNVPYTITLFENDNRTNDTQPIFRGMIELREDK